MKWKLLENSAKENIAELEYHECNYVNHRFVEYHS
jgi:hypothetical protein